MLGVVPTFSEGAVSVRGTAIGEPQASKHRLAVGDVSVGRRFAVVQENPGLIAQLALLLQPIRLERILGDRIKPRAVRIWSLDARATGLRQVPTNRRSKFL